ncbi:hypothetical protein CVT24_008380 [Panaeolus cyanescens]|uniref:G-protein coupled receptors family 1 profile domain-containing protein n=1 Tax=Panaeolus cyanescens TaxID=181874 RepID=A0A409WTM2_9AGAR|nr:hypothetical protein CVT24_008380 [Panaeolus cyanescens]
MSGTLGNVTSWQPVGESSFDILNESASLIGATTVLSFTYGIVFTLFCICVHSLVQQYKSGVRKRQAIFSLVYMSIMFSFGTIYCAVNAWESQVEFVNFRNFPGGPLAYSHYIFSSPLNILSSVVFVATSWMNDALLLWRLWVIYRGSRFYIPVVLGCSVIYITTFVLGVVLLVEALSPNETLFAATVVGFGTAYYSLTVAYTIIVTGLLLARILGIRRNLIKVTGWTEYGSQYLGIVVLIVESSALYTVWGIIFLALYLTNSPIEGIFLETLSEIQIIAPLLLMYRVSQGKAWKEDTSMQLTSINIRSGRGTFHTNASTVINSGSTSQNIHVVVDKDILSTSSDSRKNVKLDTKAEVYSMDQV